MPREQTYIYFNPICCDICQEFRPKCPRRWYYIVFNGNSFIIVLWVGSYLLHFRCHQSSVYKAPKPCIIRKVKDLAPDLK